LPPPIFASIVRSIAPILLAPEQPSPPPSTKLEIVSSKPARKKPVPKPGHKGVKIFAARSAAALRGHETRKRLQAGKGVRSVDSRVCQLVDHLRERVGIPVSMSELEQECERKGLDGGLLDRAIAHLGGRLVRNGNALKVEWPAAG
jgi:hypothetical protein